MPRRREPSPQFTATTLFRHPRRREIIRSIPSSFYDHPLTTSRVTSGISLFNTILELSSFQISFRLVYEGFIRCRFKSRYQISLTF